MISRIAKNSAKSWRLNSTTRMSLPTVISWRFLRQADRVLRKPRDFVREQGKAVDITLFAPRAGKKSLTGVLTGFDGENIELDGSEKLPLKDAAQVRLHIDF